MLKKFRSVFNENINQFLSFEKIRFEKFRSVLVFFFLILLISRFLRFKREIITIKESSKDIFKEKFKQHMATTLEIKIIKTS